MAPEENKALVRRFDDEIDKGNIAAMDELVATTCRVGQGRYSAVIPSPEAG